MSKEIDERVVSMQFDNALFEKNIQKSLKSIDDLNKSLNNLDGAKGLEEVSKAAKEVDLTPIIASAKSAEKSFSALEIAGITTISRLTNSLINFGAKMGKNFWDSTIGQIKSGGWKRASDIKAGKFMLEGLGLGDKNVELLSEAAQKAVKGTAAGLGEAMKAAGVMATSGLKDAQKMEDTLRGIAGVSAMTGRSFENIANIYSTVASNGKLMTMQLRQFSFAGINVAAKLAEAMGTSEEAVNKMVTKGQIDFETFSKIMSDTFGPHALDANKTFEGAMANMKAALSRIGEKFATPFMDNAKDVFNVLRVFFDSVKDAMAPVHEDFEKLMKIGNVFVHKVFSPFVERVKDAEGNWKWEDKHSKILDNIVAGVRNLYSIVVLVFKAIADAVRDVFPSLEDGSEGFKELTAALVPSKQGLALFKEALALVLELVRPLVTALRYAVTGLRYFVQIISAVVRSVTGLSGGLTDVIAKIRKCIHEFNIFEGILDVIMLAVTGIATAAAFVVSALSKLIKKVGEFFSFDEGGLKNIGINIINGICKGLEAGFDILKNVWTGIVNFIPNSIASILKIKSPSRVMMEMGKYTILGITKGMASEEGALENEVEGVTGIFGKLIEFGSLIVSTFGKVVWGAIEGILNLFKKLGNKIEEANLKKASKQMADTKEAMEDIYSGESVSKASNNVESVGEDWVETNEKVELSTESLGDKISTTYENIKTKIKDLGINLEAFKFILAGFGVALVATFSKVAFSMNLLSGLGKTIATLSVIAGAIMLIKNVDFTPVVDGLKKFFDNIKMIVSNLNIFDNLKNFFNSVKSFIQETDMVMLAAKALAFSFAIVIVRAIHGLTTLAMGLTNSINNIGVAIKSLSNMKLGIYETTADKILKFAVAISAIVVSISILAKAWAENPAAMGAALGTIAVLMLIMGGFTILTAKIAKTKGQAIIASSAMKQIQSASWAILALVGSFILIASQINKLTPEGIIWALTSFTVVLVMFAEFVRMISESKAQVSIGTILGMSVMLLAVGKLMRDFSEMLESAKDTNDLALAFTKMVAPIMTALFGIALILKTLQNIDKSSEKTTVSSVLTRIFGKDNKKTTSKSAISSDSAKTLLAIAAVMVIMSRVMKTFSTFDSDQMFRAVEGMTYAFIAIAGLCYVLEHTNTEMTSISGFARDVAITVVALIAAVKLLTTMNDYDFDNAYSRIKGIALTVGAIMVVVAFIVRILCKQLDEVTVRIKGLGITMASLAVGLAALGAVFSLIPEERLRKFVTWTNDLVAYILVAAIAITAINKLFDEFNAFSDDEKGAKNAKNTFLNMLGMLLGIGMVMGSLIVLSLLDPDSLLIPISCITLIIGMLALMFNQLSRIKDVENAKSIFDMIALVITLLTVALVGLASMKVDINRVLAISGAMALVLLSLTNLIGSITKLNGLRINKNTLVVLRILMGIILVLGGLFTLIALTNVNWASMAAIGVSMAAAISSIAIFAASVNKLNGLTINKNTITVLRLLLGIISAIGAIFIVIGFLRVDWTTIAAIGGSMAAAILSLAVLMTVISKIASLTINKNTITTLAVLGVMIIGIGATLGLLTAVISTGNAAAALFAVASITIVLAAMAGMLAVCMVVTANPAILPTLGILTAIVIGISLFVALLAKIGGENAMKAAGAISLVMGIIAVLVIVLSIVPKATLVLTALSGLLRAIGALILGTGIAVAAVLLTLGLSMAALTGGLKLLEGLDYATIINGLMGATLAISQFGTAVLLTGIKMAAGIAAIAAAAFLLSKVLLPFMVMVGTFIGTGLATGMLGSTKEVKKAMSKVDGAIVAQSKKDLQWSSPSKVFKAIGGFLMDGLNLGIIQKIPFVGDSLKAGIENIIAWLNGKAAELEETGDTWGNAIKIGLGGALGDFDFEIPSLSDVFEEATAGFEFESEAAGDAGDALEGYGDSAETASTKTDKLSDSIASTLDMFTEFNDQAYLSSKDVIPAFMSQLEGVAKWRDELASLSARGLGEVIIQELEDMGPQAYEKVHALYTMTNSELAMMNIMYKQKLALQNGSRKKIEKSFKKLGDGITEEMEESMDEMSDGIVDSMSDLGSSMMTALKKQIDYEKIVNQVTGFRDNVADKIRSSMSIFEAVGEQEKVKAEDLLKNMKEQVKHVGKWSSMIVEMAAKGFDEGLVATLTEMGPQSYSKVEAFLTMNEQQIAEANRLYEASEQVPEYGADKIVKAFAQAGFTASMGLTDSFLEGLDPEAVEQALTDLGQTSITALQDSLQDPYSAMEIGEQWAGDFAAGLEAKVEEVKKAAKDLADAANPENAKELIDLQLGQSDYARVMTEVANAKAKAAEENRLAKKQSWDKGEQDRLSEYDKYLLGFNQADRMDEAIDNEVRKNIGLIQKGKHEPLENMIKKYAGSSSFTRNKYVAEYINGKYGYALSKMANEILPKIKVAADSGDSSAKADLQYFNELIDKAVKNGAAGSFYAEPRYKYVYDTAMNMAEQFSEPEVLDTAAEGGESISQNAIGGSLGIGQTAYDIKRANLMNTPAVLAMKEVGAATAMGYSAGAEEEKETMEETGKSLGDSLAGGFIISLRDNLATLMDAILNSDEATPKIKPVIDVEGTRSKVSDIFKGLNFSTGIDVSTKNRDKSVVDAINGISNKEVVDAVNELASMVDNLRMQATRLQVVMDTGQLVGVLTPGIDQSLGMNAINAGRWVI